MATLLRSGGRLYMVHQKIPAIITPDLEISTLVSFQLSMRFKPPRGDGQLYMARQRTSAITTLNFMEASVD